MKRITYFLLVFVFLMGISSTAFAAPGDTYYTGEYEFDAPRRFEAVGFICEDIDPFIKQCLTTTTFRPTRSQL